MPSDISLLNRSKLGWLESYEVTLPHIEGALEAMLQHQIDFSELFFQTRQTLSLFLDQGKIRSAGAQLCQGVGARALAGAQMGYAYQEGLRPQGLLNIAHKARSIAAAGGKLQRTKVTGISFPSRYPQDQVIAIEEMQRYAQHLQTLDTILRKENRAVYNVQASLSFQDEAVLIANSEGTLTWDLRPLLACRVTVFLDHQGRRARGSAGGGGRGETQHFLSDDPLTALPLTYGREALRQAEVNVSAREAPAGRFGVVLGHGWPGILLHEAVGHGLEGDFNRKGTSVFTGKLGKQVASPLCTVVDDGTIPERRGSLTIDDEGVQTSRNVLIEDGILKGYLQDRLNSRLMGHPLTGNGRRESYAYPPLPRMTNTFLLPGTSSPEEMIASLPYGIFAPHFSGGQVDITSGNFVFSTAEAYLIEKGRLTVPLKEVTLIGSGIEVMNSIVSVGNDFELDPGQGMCGKEGQNVPVGVGQPTLLISALTVGGTVA